MGLLRRKIAGLRVSAVIGLGPKKASVSIGVNVGPSLAGRTRWKADDALRV